MMIDDLADRLFVPNKVLKKLKANIYIYIYINKYIYNIYTYIYIYIYIYKLYSKYGVQSYDKSVFPTSFGRSRFQEKLFSFEKHAVTEDFYLTLYFWRYVIMASLSSLQQ